MNFTMNWKISTKCVFKIWLFIFYMIFPLSILVEGMTELKLIVEPENTIVLHGSSAVLNCAASSSIQGKVPKIRWRGHDRQPLNFIGDLYRSQLDNGSLYIRNVNPGSEDLEGEYQCIASLDDIGSIVSRSAVLEVAPKLKLRHEPKDLEVFSGQTAYFNCAIDGSFISHVVWLKDNHPIHLDETRMLILPSGSLEIDEVRSSDKGYYQCNISALEQTVSSRKAFLNVIIDVDESANLKPPSFIATPRSVIVVEGNSVTLDCVANGNPKPWITWLKDGIAIDMADLDSRFRKIGTGSLQITGVKEDDQGMYQCRAINREDSNDASATIEVQVPPRFIRKPTDQSAFEKEDLEFECEVYGKPEPDVHWEKNGEVVRTGDYLQLVNGNNLRILGLMALDSGVFQCLATNPAGNIQAAARLSILQPGTNNLIAHSKNSNNNPLKTYHPLAPPTDEAVAPVQDVPSAPQQLAALIISTRFVTLSWKPPSNPRGEITMYSVYYQREGSMRERIVNTTRSRLEEVNIQGLIPDKKYRFRVVAHNEHGPGASSETLEVITQAEVHVPGAPTFLRATAISPNSLLVEWQPPEHTNGPIQGYKLFYMKEGSVEEHHIVTGDLQYELTDLSKFTDYSVWVAAFNQNGPGSSTEELTVRTLSDVPSQPPQNVTLEASSSTSVIVRWEPPPKESQNGVITGYKLKYRKQNQRKRGGDTVTTPGDRRLYALIGLEKQTTYHIRLWALNVNGSGPPTEWYSIDTYENDLDESQVPDPPKDLKVRSMTDTITVSWNPPHNQNIMVRGYTIGWGKGIPDAYNQLLDGKQRFYVIENLEPNSEYVISLRANNEMGDGRPVYASVRTKEEVAPEPVTPLIPPVGLKAIVLSSRSVVVYWIDSTLSKTQYVTDNRYYMVRYTASHHSASPRYKYYNATDLNCMIDELKPNTQYEFTVKVVRGRRESPWSMVVTNMTMEERPSSPPRDLTIVAIDNNPKSVNLNWQPPKQPNGAITGYLIMFTTDVSLNDREWVVEAVVGDKMTTSVKGLQPDSTYYFKIQARNSKGYGPFSNVVSYTTGARSYLATDLDYDSRLPIKDGGTLPSMSILYIAVGSSIVVCTVVILVLVVVCCKRRNHDRSKKGYMKGNVKNKPGKGIKPPDLWIHHDQMELKALEKTQSTSGSGGDGPSNVSMTVNTLPRTSQEYDGEHDAKYHHPGATNSLDKRAYISSYAGGASNEEKTSTARRVIKPKAITLTGSGQVARDSVGTTGAQNSSGDLTARPLYPRTQYSISRAHVTLDQAAQSPENPYSLHDSSYDTLTTQSASHHTGPSSTQQGSFSTIPSVSGSSEQGGSGTMGKRMQGHPLKSFSVPAPPPQSAPSTPQQKHVVSSVTIRPQGTSSPYKKAGILASGGSATPPTTSSKSRAVVTQAASSNEDNSQIKPSYSTEELNQEMANLEGLMKDLNAITASEFEC